MNHDKKTPEELKADAEKMKAQMESLPSELMERAAMMALSGIVGMIEAKEVGIVVMELTRHVGTLTVEIDKIKEEIKELRKEGAHSE